MQRAPVVDLPAAVDEFDSAVASSAEVVRVDRNNGRVQVKAFVVVVVVVVVRLYKAQRYTALYVLRR